MHGLQQLLSETTGLEEFFSTQTQFYALPGWQRTPEEIVRIFESNLEEVLRQVRLDREGLHGYQRLWREIRECFSFAPKVDYFDPNTARKMLVYQLGVYNNFADKFDEMLKNIPEHLEGLGKPWPVYFALFRNLDPVGDL